MLKPFSIIVMCVALAAAAPPQQEPVALELRPVLEAGRYTALELHLRFRGDADGETELRLPNDWGGQVALYRAIRDLSADAEISTGPNEWTRLLRHAPNATVNVRYRVVDDGSASRRGGAGNDYRVRIEPDYFFALGDAMIAQPSHISTDTPAEFAVTGLPEGAAFASDAEHARFGRRLVFGDLIESTTIGGNVRIVDAGGGARLAIHGAVDARDDNGWRESFTNIANAQRTYWGADLGAYMVTIIAEAPENPGSISVGGTGRGDGFAFFATANAPPETLDRTLAHEMMHTWVPRRIGRLNDSPNEAQDYWLSEGFTDWAMMRTLMRSGLWREGDFASVFNEYLRDYDLSPVHEAPNARILTDYWNDRDVSDLPYRRGMLLATYWDAQVRAATRGRKDFDDVLLWMQARARREPRARAVDLLARAMRRVARLDISADLARLVERGEAAPIPEDAFGVCGDLAWVEQPEFHRGFDVQATLAADNIIAGTVVDGPAWRAGLRDGMRLIGRRGGEIGNPTVEIAYEIEDAQGRRVLSWMPQGARTVRFRQLNLAAAQQNGGPGLGPCGRRLAGL